MMDFGLPDEPPVTRYQLLPHHSATHDSALDSRRSPLEASMAPLPKDHSKFPTSNENPNENLEKKQVIQNKHSIFWTSKNDIVFRKSFKQ